ncbi:MAG: hypothetical protein ABJN65_11965 [Parasphingorhabdus sp.]
MALDVMVTTDNLRDARIAASMAANPNMLPSPSVYFQDFNFGGTMFDAAFGNVEGGSVSGAGAGVADIAIDERLDAELKRRKEDNPAGDASMIVEAGEQQREALAPMQARSAQLGQEIAQIEAQFEAEMGDAWREIAANDVLDPDSAQRRDGESMDQYRARLEAMLVAEMIDANGNIKPEYADSPYARWAQAQYEKAEWDGKIERRTDPNISVAEALAIDTEIVQNGSFNQIRQSQAELASQGTESEILADGTDGRRDDKVEERMTSAANETAGFITQTLG